ncbi:DUF6508 domain-containing protein [Piscibacillus sp. B03]|uniref:DUF6508 domain-containing protein n=1 Tax=Piscibacillus sp. B03 TaxID=3457430 RepID=UPI003FCDBA7E
MTNYENLFKYINYFKKPDQNFMKWEKQDSGQDGVYIMPFPEYEQELRDFN